MAQAMFAAIAALMSRTPSALDQRLQIDALGAYRSRGKGKGRHQKAKLSFKQNKRKGL